MPVTVINSNGTTQLKVGPGYIRQIIPISAGSAWTLQIKDGPIGNTNGANTVMANTAVTVAVPANPFASGLQLMYFSNGIQIITAGTTPGELDIDWV